MAFYFYLRIALLIKKTLRIVFVQKKKVTFIICFREVLTQQGSEPEAVQSDELLIGRERMSGQEY